MIKICIEEKIVNKIKETIFTNFVIFFLFDF
jgi:hypothetical protein